jgi:hypothetical protein
MQTMMKRLLTLRRQAVADATGDVEGRQAVAGATGHVDRRSGAPARRRPDPMPRLRWYA